MPDITISIDGTQADAITRRYNFGIGIEVDISLLFHGSTYRTRFQTVRSLYEYASDQTVRRGTTDSGIPWYRERVPSAASVDTFVIDVDPAAGVEAVDMVPFWGVVVGGDDATGTNEFGRRRIDLRVFILAKKSDYANKSAVETAFGSEVL